MRNRRKWCIATSVLAALTFLAGPSAAPAADSAPLDVPILVEEPAGVARHGEYVRSGIPLPASAGVLDARLLRLFARGPGGEFDRELPLQARVTSRWGGTPGDLDRPARWVLLDFAAGATAAGRSEYRLRYGGESWAARQSEDVGLASADGERIAVDTGRLRFTVAMKRFGVFEDLAVSGEKPSPLAPVRPAFDVRVVTPAGREFLASGAPPSEVSIEESGPLTAVLLVRGHFAARDGEKLLEGWAGYSLRVQVYAGSSAARVFFTLENDGFYGREADWSATGGIPRWLEFESLMLLLSTAIDGRVTGDLEAGVPPVNLDAWSFRLLQTHRIERIPEDLDQEERNFAWALRVGERELARGARSRGAFGLEGERGALSIAARHFFENWPGAMSWREQVLAMELWPAEGRWPPGPGDGPYVLEGGRHKTRELVIDFAGGDPGLLAARTARPLFARAPAEFCAASGAVGPFAPLSFGVGNPATARALARLNRMHDAVVDVHAAESQPLGVAEPAVPPISLVTQREARGNAFKVAPYDVDMYGFMNFGDLPHALGFSSLHYDLPGGILLQYLRHDGKREYLDIGEEMVRHRYDIDQYHCRETAHLNWEWYNGLARIDQGWHGDYRRSPAYRSEATPHANYTWLSGLVLHHALTGDPRSLEAARENADAMVRIARLALPGESTDREILQHPEVRAAALAVQNLVDFYSFTGERQYFDAAVTVWRNGLRYSEEIRGCAGLFTPDERQHVWNTVLLLEPLRKLHAATGDPDILAALARTCRRLRDTYIAGSGRVVGGLMLPLQLPVWLTAKAEPATEIPYGILVADAFAWVYLMTGEESYLSFARHLFHDAVVYREAPGGMPVPPDYDAAVSYNPWKFPNTEVRVHAWTLRGGQVYLAAEWLLSGGQPPAFRFPGDDFRKDSPPVAVARPSPGGPANPPGSRRPDATADPVIEVPAALARSGLLSARFSASVPRPGEYEVAARWPADATGSVEYRISHPGGEFVATASRDGRGGGWVALGQVFLDADEEVSIALSGPDGIGRMPGEIRFTLRAR